MRAVDADVMHLVIAVTQFYDPVDDAAMVALSANALFPGRGHSQPVDHGWREVADYALDFLTRVGVPATARAQSGPGA